jgi:hypothetical protein
MLQQTLELVVYWQATWTEDLDYQVILEEQLVVDRTSHMGIFMVRIIP